MGSFSMWHWLIVLLVVVLIFGTKKLRNMGSDLGGAVKNFKEGMREESQSNDGGVQEDRKITVVNDDVVPKTKQTIDVEMKEK